MNPLQRLLSGRSNAPTTAPASDDFAGRLDLLNSNAAKAQTPAQAIAVMQESVGITNDLFKSFAKAKEESPTSDAPAKAEEPAPAAESEPEAEPPAADLNEPISDNPDDADLMADAPPSDAPAAAPEAIAAASGKEGEDAPNPEPEKPMAKSVTEIMADHAPTNNGTEEPLVDATGLIDELIKSIGATQQQEVENATSLQTIMDYQEQLGAMLTKSIEGQKILFERQSEIFERLGGIESTQTQAQESQAQQSEALNKSMSKALQGVSQYVEGIQRQPQGTPSGRAPLASNSVPGLALTDVPQAEQTYNGWTRGELKKSIEGHIRSDRCVQSGVTSSHFLSIGKTENLADLDPLIFEVAAAERALLTKK
ncbi:hypothetical protein EON83_11030 [bacterium]|nr:MAG: hypothetical protein EON83_11030 [bacterium]